MSLQVEVLERSFTAVAPKADEFVAAFYARLFSAHPEVKPLSALRTWRSDRRNCWLRWCWPWRICGVRMFSARC